MREWFSSYKMKQSVSSHTLFCVFLLSELLNQRVKWLQWGSRISGNTSTRCTIVCVSTFVCLPRPMKHEERGSHTKTYFLCRFILSYSLLLMSQSGMEEHGSGCLKWVCRHSNPVVAVLLQLGPFFRPDLILRSDREVRGRRKMHSAFLFFSIIHVVVFVVVFPF